jgi:hypothetical protein
MLEKHEYFRRKDNPFSPPIKIEKSKASAFYKVTSKTNETPS